GLEFRALLGRFVAVCQAVAYAHSRGVLHRDLKPANIMLGQYGETLVVDWGLAKVVSKSETHRSSGAEESLLKPVVQGISQTVGTVGTPAYMSPEQAAGEAEGLTPATDVYALGATLYTMLTNRLPFQGPIKQILIEVQRGGWAPAHQVNGAIPAA